jgi:hypothetical protein
VYSIGLHPTGRVPWACTSRACTSLGLHLMSVYLVGVYLMSLHLKGVHLTGRAPHGPAPLRPAPYWPCISLAVHLTERAPHGRASLGVVCLEAFRIFNLGKCSYAPPYSEIAKAFWPKFLESNAHSHLNLEGHSKECVVKETTDTTSKQTISTNLYFGKSTKLPSTYRSFIRRFIHLQPCLRHVSSDLSISNTKAHV